jgi:DNA-binding NarL/FixJ family response regulator
MYHVFLVNNLPILSDEISLHLKEKQLTSKVTCLLNLLDPPALTDEDLLIYHATKIDLAALQYLDLYNEMGVKVVIWFGDHHSELLTEYFRKNFFGYLPKETSLTDINDIFRSLKSRVHYVHKNFTNHILNIQKQQSTRMNLRPELLTEQEWQVLQCLIKSYSNKQIANQLYLNVSTIKHHVSSIIKKLHVRNRNEVVVIAIKNKWF